MTAEPKPLDEFPVLASGQVISQYRLIEEVGRGGIGVVWKAMDTRLDRVVALKTLRETSSDEGEAARFEREAKLLAALDHPGIVTIFSIEEVSGLTFIAMEYVEGSTLEGSIPAGGLSLDRFLTLAVPIAEAVDAAHARGVTHRDLKPGNIMVDSRGRVKILDFGLAKLRPPVPADLADPGSKTGTGEIQGTLHYMAPEQLRGGAVDGRCDVFALGVVFYEMLTGSPPFDGPTPSDVIAAILMTEPAPVYALRSGLPSSLVRLIGGCLEKNLERRIGTVAEIVDALIALRRDSGAASGVLRAVGGAIAVLPLENLSGDPSQEYIADGMTEALITDLARSGGLKVISRTSVMGYKGVHRAIRDVARELGVEAVVEGTVLCVGGKVRISARLIRAEDDELLWAERFDRDLSEVLEVQSEVAQAIATEVQSRLGRGRSRKLPRRRQVDPEVYLLDLQGRYYFTLRTEEGFRAAIQCFEEATRKDPTYAPSLVGLADGHNMLVNFGMIPVRQGVPTAKAALAKALELDPDSAEAHRALATIRWISEFDWPGAEREYRLALGLDPNSALTRYWYGMFQGIWGRFEKGIDELGRALELDPLSQIVVAGIGWIHYFARRYDEALRYYDKTLQVDPAFFLGRWWRGEALIELSRFEEGIADLERAVELGGRTSRSLGYLGYAYGRAGRSDEARALLNTLEERAANGYVPPYFPALICCGLREVEQAFDFLHQAVALPDSMARDLKVDPPLDILRPDPRFRDLLGRVGLD